MAERSDLSGSPDYRLSPEVVTMYTHIKSVQILISLLKQFHISHVVISPGTRNTALAGSIEKDDFFHCYSIVDERSAGFFALGLAEALDEPVCVSCTAATATCNYFPAVKEAYERHIQLVALTADQNAYEMFHMEDQCIDQVDMFHGYVKMAVDVPKAQNDHDFWYCNRRINEALLELNHHGKGPVQINYHMDYGLNEISTYDVKELPVARKIDRVEGKIDFQFFADILKKKKRILVVGGSGYDKSGKLRDALNAFSEKFNCAVISDTYANAYSDNRRIMNPRALGDVITSDQIPYLAPDLILSFGSVYYSTVKYFLPQYAGVAEHWQIAEDGMINDGYHCLKKVFECRPEEFFQQVSDCSNGQNDNGYCRRWQKRLDMMHFQNMSFTNLAVIREFCRQLPEQALLHTTVLDSIRMSNYVDMKPSVRCFANIGADGIDGALSAFLGQAREERERAYLLIGDLSLLYDMNALLQEQSPNIRILVINNHAGAEFHKNFGLQRIPELNEYIAAGHHVNIKDCIGQQFDYLTASDMKELKIQLSVFMHPSEKPMLLEVFTDADADAKSLKTYWQENREEIPGMKLSAKGRIKQTARKLLGSSGEERIRKLLKR